MKKQVVIVLLSITLLSGCNNPVHKELAPSSCNDDTLSLKELGLSSWKDTKLDGQDSVTIHSIIEYVKSVTCENSKNTIPVKDRIAVFDMDGTIACEKPVSMEIFCMYTLAFNDTITSVKNDTVYTKNGKSFPVDSLAKKIMTKLKNKNISSDLLVAKYSSLLNQIININIPKYKPDSILLKNQFYKPMVELIHYLKKNDFQVYIVSGSLQQFIWSAVENVDTLKIDRSHIIGSLVNYDTVHYYTRGDGNKFFFDINNSMTNTSRNKAVNIYNKIGKIPVFAFGNTVNDFDMFAFTSSNNKKNKGDIPYKTMCVLLNHDDSTLEANYHPFHKDFVKLHWNDSNFSDTTKWRKHIFDTIMQNHSWKIANISECFVDKFVFVDNN
ncbi:MAG: hypothetical protein A2W99_06730 [Bacteroidetes bacterium GWF2_33_16]|nr:MAG: hypothetical protein A2X00_12165 [Bacteroidetes bacterium GWE2_32_14]OFY04389.1 MAG: hypothetical protein A2W99_06730 [Bacteroidetes bacterium GWF2_33_16]